MEWSTFHDKQVALLGAGIENLSLVPHLEKCGAAIFICDQRGAALDDEFATQHPTVTLVTGDQHLKNLSQFDFLFRSPGMPIATVEAALAGVKNRPEVTSATDLFLAMTVSTVIGVTGTKGKGTTSTMIGSILDAAGKDVVVAGNIGKPIFTIFDDLSPETFVVLEMSSFQLEDLSHSPHIAVVLPISEDHLRPLSAESPNFHPSMNDYVAAKAHITIHQTTDDLLVFAADNADSTAIASITKAKKVGVSQAAYQNHWNVGSRGEIYRVGEPFMDLSDLELRGQHVFLNATVAAAVCTELGVPKEAIAAGLKAFEPLPHRLQDIGTMNGIRFIDDSYATAPDATIAALSAFTDPVVLIAGGSSKGADFESLARVISDVKVKAVILIGQEAPRLKQALSSNAPDISVHDGGTSMDQAVTQALKLASNGDVILLSPACASKDMFKNAADRGDQFQNAAKVLTSA